MGRDQLVLDLEVEASKVCKTCSQALPLSAFHRTTKSADGRRAHCKSCRNLRERTELKEANHARYMRWAAANRDRVREIQKAFHARHPEAQRAYAARWRWESDGLEVLRRAKRRRRYGRSEDDLLYAQVLLGDPCAYCDADSTTIDHIDATASGGSNGWENLTPACRSCNSRKQKLPLLQFLATR